MNRILEFGVCSLIIEKIDIEGNLDFQNEVCYLEADELNPAERIKVSVARSVASIAKTRPNTRPSPLSLPDSLSFRRQRHTLETDPRADAAAAAAVAARS